MKTRVFCGLAIFTTAMAFCALVALGGQVLPVGGAAVANAAHPSQFRLYPVVKAPVGASQGYLIHVEWFASVFGGDRFSPNMAAVEETAATYAVYARYTVLEPGVDGVGRLRVEAMVLDADTLRPLAMPIWQGVLRLPPSEQAWEGDNYPDWALGRLPLDWLHRWITSPQEAPATPLSPKDWWWAGAHIGDHYHFGTFAGMRGKLDLVGEYRELLRPEVNAPPSALIYETFRGEFEETGPQPAPPPVCDAGASGRTGENALWNEDCLMNVLWESPPVALHAEGVNSIMLVQDDFPWSGSGSVTLDMVFAPVDAPRKTLELTVNAVRYSAPFRQPEVESLTPGIRVAALSNDAWSGLIDGLPSRAPARVYSFWGREGDRAWITMDSRRFVPYLVLMDADWNSIAESYTFDATSRAEVFTTLPYTGMYYVQATASDGWWVLGEYEIALELGPSVDRGPRSRDPGWVSPWDTWGADPDSVWDNWSAD